jgi:hypothetical protein
LATPHSNAIIKSADDTTVVDLVTGDNEKAYRKEVSDLAVWCQDNNFSLNVTKELIVDYRRTRSYSHQRGCSGVGLKASSSSVTNH